MVAGTPRSRKSKGMNFQKYVVNRIKKVLNISEGILSRPGGHSGSDVFLVTSDAKEKFPFSVECKNQATLYLKAWIRQSMSHAEKEDFLDWLVVFKIFDRKPPFVCLDWSLFTFIDGGKNVLDIGYCKKWKIRKWMNENEVVRVFDDNFNVVILDFESFLSVWKKFIENFNG